MSLDKHSIDFLRPWLALLEMNFNLEYGDLERNELIRNIYQGQEPYYGVEEWNSRVEPQWKQLIGFLTSWCGRHRPTHHQRDALYLQTFSNNLRQELWLSEAMKCWYAEGGKRAVEHMAFLCFSVEHFLVDGEFAEPEHQKQFERCRDGMAHLLDGADGITACSPGVQRRLIEAEQQMVSSFKESILRTMIKELGDEVSLYLAFDQLRGNYRRGNEIHYAQSAWDSVRIKLGMALSGDPFSTPAANWVQAFAHEIALRLSTGRVLDRLLDRLQFVAFFKNPDEHPELLKQLEQFFGKEKAQELYCGLCDDDMALRLELSDDDVRDYFLFAIFDELRHDGLIRVESRLVNFGDYELSVIEDSGVASFAEIRMANGERKTINTFLKGFSGSLFLKKNITEHLFEIYGNGITDLLNSGWIEVIDFFIQHQKDAIDPNVLERYLNKLMPDPKVVIQLFRHGQSLREFSFCLRWAVRHGYVDVLKEIECHYPHELRKQFLIENGIRYDRPAVLAFLIRIGNIYPSGHIDWVVESGYSDVIAALREKQCEDLLNRPQLMQLAFWSHKTAVIIELIRAGLLLDWEQINSVIENDDARIMKEILQSSCHRQRLDEKMAMRQALYENAEHVYLELMKAGVLILDEHISELVCKKKVSFIKEIVGIRGEFALDFVRCMIEIKSDFFNFYELVDWLKDRILSRSARLIDIKMFLSLLGEESFSRQWVEFIGSLLVRMFENYGAMRVVDDLARNKIASKKYMYITSFHLMMKSEVLAHWWLNKEVVATFPCQVLFKNIIYYAASENCSESVILKLIEMGFPLGDSGFSVIALGYTTHVIEKTVEKFPEFVRSIGRLLPEELNFDTLLKIKSCAMFKESSWLEIFTPFQMSSMINQLLQDNQLKLLCRVLEEFDPWSISEIRSLLNFDFMQNFLKSDCSSNCREKIDILRRLIGNNSIWIQVIDKLFIYHYRENLLEEFKLHSLQVSQAHLMQWLVKSCELAWSDVITAMLNQYENITYNMLERSGVVSWAFAHRESDIVKRVLSLEAASHFWGVRISKGDQAQNFLRQYHRPLKKWVRGFFDARMVLEENFARQILDVHPNAVIPTVENVLREMAAYPLHRDSKWMHRLIYVCDQLRIPYEISFNLEGEIFLSAALTHISRQAVGLGTV